MHTRLRRTLLVLALVFLFVGVAAFIGTAWNTYDVVSGTPTFDNNGNMIDSGSTSGPGRTYLVLSALLPAIGAVGVALAVLCVAGLILSFVLVDALENRGPVGGPGPVAVDPPDSPYGPPEVLGSPART
jgi:hypothetical protein